MALILLYMDFMLNQLNEQGVLQFTKLKVIKLGKSSNKYLEHC